MKLLVAFLAVVFVLSFLWIDRGLLSAVNKPITQPAVFQTDLEECYGERIQVHLVNAYSDSQPSEFVEFEVDPKTWGFKVTGQNADLGLEGWPCLTEPVRAVRIWPNKRLHFDADENLRPKIPGQNATLRSLVVRPAFSAPVQRAHLREMLEDAEYAAPSHEGYSRAYGKGQAGIEGLWGFPNSHSFWETPVVGTCNSICNGCGMFCSVSYRYKYDLAIKYEFRPYYKVDNETNQRIYTAPNFVGIDMEIRRFVDQWIVRKGEYDLEPSQ